jgi:predicted patatin/cPLA2 family phospholipase
VKEFIHAYRLKWMTDIDYLLRVCQEHGFSNARLRNSSTRLRIACTDWVSGKTRWFGNHDDVLDAVRASVSIPLLSRTPVLVGGAPYLDGGISASVGDLVRYALSEGGERVIAVDLSSSVAWWQKLGLRWYARSAPEGLRRAIIRMTYCPHPEPLQADPRVYLIRPRETMVTRLQFSLEKLKAAYARGFEETLSDYNLRAFLGRTD